MFHKLRFISIIAKIMYIKWNISKYLCVTTKNSITKGQRYTYLDNFTRILIIKQNINCLNIRTIYKLNLDPSIQYPVE